MLRPQPALVILTIAVIATEAIDQPLVRDTNYGEVKGFLREEPDSIFIEHYLGIPYAAPPLGNLRWRPPQRHPGWSDENEPLDATRFRLFCPQLNFSGDGNLIGEEDCLHLNVYVPQNNNTSEGTPSAVFFWIHGGAYLHGYSDVYNTHFPWYADSILVTINYRLGAFGFLSTGDSHASGNYGMMDMIAALQWVNENIGYFGGDKDRVTIGGNSAGGSAVQLLALSDSANSLFQRVIAQSGSAFSSFAFDPVAGRGAQSFLSELSCPTYSNLLAMECLRGKDMKEIVEASWNYNWCPVQDGELFIDTPQQLTMDTENVARLQGRYDYIAGSTSFDSVAPFSNINKINDSESLLAFLEKDFGTHFDDAAKIADAVYMNYIDWTDELPSDQDVWKRLAVSVTRDWKILAPSLNFSNVASSGKGFNSSVYYYLFTPRPSVAMANTKWAYKPEAQYDWVTGARHAEELSFLFGVPLTTDGTTEAEKEVSIRMMKYWGNFIRNGNPNDGFEVPTIWPQYTVAEPKVMVLGNENADSRNVTRVQENLETDKVRFWSDEIPLYEEGDGVNPVPPSPETNVTDPTPPVVNTTTGAVRGLHLQREKYSVDRFFRIPYAKPPTGLLRFQPPQPHPGWEGILDCDDRSSAKQWLHICPQRNLRGNGNVGRENCLFLNIWVPGGVNVPKEQPLPVLVWIYGGGFNIGTSIGFTFYYDMERLVAQGAVIGVTLNYRLNSLGFLSTGDEHAPGNMGLLDNTAALQWIQDNIANFGGDPGKVTIFGQSAGGAAVSLHMISPVSKPLFHRGISQSGAVPATWTYITNPFPQAERLANNLNCPTDNTNLLVSCLRDKPLKELVSASVGIGWGAVVDGYFVPEDPKYILNASMDKDYIIGHNSMEGHGAMSGLFPKLNFGPDRPGSNMDRQDVRRAARIVASPDHVSEAVAYEFIEWEEPESAYLWPRLAITYMATDWQFSIGPYVSASVRTESSGPGRTYMYILNELSRVDLFPYWVESNHLRELVYTFGHPFEETSIAERFTDADRTLSLAMMTYWTNFAWSGNPNYPNQVDIPIEWPEYTSDSKSTIFFNTSMPEEPEKYLKDNYRGDIMHMWREILYKMRDLPLETCPATTRLEHGEGHHQRISPNMGRNNPEKAADCPDLPYVRSTLLGCIEGYEYDWQGNTVERYLGIPFAQPPTGSLRFSNPVEVMMPWSETKTVKDFRKNCPQGVYDEATMDEDCLYLSIYVPQANTNDTLAVMVWIHGGVNQRGNGNGYQGDGLATEGNIIVVSVNYRVGSLGFLTTDDDAARGNFGLFDQHMAISWVKNNIENFGGDPSRITIAGQSAGAEDAHYHTLSPMTDSLGISRVVMESPPSMSVGDLKQRGSAIALAEEASCDTTAGNEALVECLRNLAIGDLISAQQRTGLNFVPTVDGVFLPEHPITLAEDMLRVRQWTYLMGANDGDGSIRWSSAQNVEDEDGYHAFVTNGFYPKYDWRTSSIDEHYAHREDLDFFADVQKIQKSLIQATGDGLFIFSTHKLAMDYSQFGSDVFFYYYTSSKTPGVGLPMPEWLGAGHGAEVPLVSGMIFNDADIDENVKQLSRDLMEYWSNFVKSGDPNNNGEEASDLLEWPKFKEVLTDKNYIILDVGNNTVATNNLRPTDDAFWNDYMPRQSVYCEEPIVPTTTTTTSPPPAPQSPTISISNGPVMGKRLTNEHFDIHAFMGIPYAKPPVEELRFAKSSPVEDWMMTLDATTPKAPCPQLDRNGEVVGSEDCLYLDVFMQTGVVGTNANSMPVMIWIHGDSNGDVGHLGGSFWSGGGSPGWSENFDTIDPSYLAYFGNVMIVRPNFRLGALGYLTVEDNVIKGNYGLSDLQAVVEWTSTNAHNFGGDVNKITVFGQGSGAVLAEILGTLPPTDIHVKRVISQSGSVFSPWSFCEEDAMCAETANKLAASLSCGSDDSEDILTCLRAVSMEDIVKGVPFIPFENVGSPYNAWGTWRLRRDGEIISKDIDIEGLFTAVDLDYMAGTTNHEFYRHLEAAYSKSENSSLQNAVSDTNRFLYGSTEWPEEMKALLVHSYTPWDDIDNKDKIREASVKYYGDLIFAASSAKSTQLIASSSSSTTYQYVLMKGLNSSNIQTASWVGSCHGDDIIYQFGFPVISPSGFSEKDREISHMIMSHWTNFAWSGNPDSAFSSKTWREYGTDAYYMELGNRRSLWRPKDYNIKKNSLWNEVIPIINSDSPSPSTSTMSVTNTTSVPQEITETPPSEDEECVITVPPIAEGLGLNLTPEEADTAIYAMFSVCLILGVALIALLVTWWVKSTRPKKHFNNGKGHLNGSFISGGKPDDYLERKDIVSAL